MKIPTKNDKNKYQIPTLHLLNYKEENAAFGAQCIDGQYVSPDSFPSAPLASKTRLSTTEKTDCSEA